MSVPGELLHQRTGIHHSPVLDQHPVGDPEVVRDPNADAMTAGGNSHEVSPMRSGQPGSLTRRCQPCTQRSPPRPAISATPTASSSSHP